MNQGRYFFSTGFFYDFLLNLRKNTDPGEICNALSLTFAVRWEGKMSQAVKKSLTDEKAI